MAKLPATIAFLINLPAALFFGMLWMKNLKRQLQITTTVEQYDWIINSFKSFNRDIFNLTSIEQICAYLSIFLFAHFILKSLLEYLAEYTTIKKFEKITKCLGNLVQSTILYSIILGFIVIPMIITNYQLNEQASISTQPGTQLTPQNDKYATLLIFKILETFFYGRILFSIGYLIGTVTTFQSLRAYGLALDLASIAIAIAYTYDCNIWAYF